MCHHIFKEAALMSNNNSQYVDLKCPTANYEHGIDLLKLVIENL